MRLLFLTQTYPRFAGDSSGPFIRDLALGLTRLGESVEILAPHATGLPSRWHDEGLEVNTFRYAPQRFEAVGYSRTLEADEGLRPLARLVAPLYLAGARRALARRLRAGDLDGVHAHWVVPNGLVAAALAKRCRFGVGLHGSDVFLAEKPLVRAWVGRALVRASFMTGCSPELVDRVAALGFPRQQARVIPYGVDGSRFRPEGEGRQAWRERLRVPAEAPLALGVGRMATKKGFQVLIAALPELLVRCPDLHVALAGGGDRLAEFERATERWRDRVHLPGAVRHDELPRLYRAADLFVMPAVHDRRGNVDGLPNVVLEAMASGLPVVATAISGLPLAVEPERNGLLVAEGSAAALGDAIARLVERADWRRELGRSGRRKVETELTWTAVAERYREAYRTAGIG